MTIHSVMPEHEEVIVNTVKKEKIFLIFLVAFVLRLIVFLLFRPWDIQVQSESILVGDAPEYHRLAECIVNHFTFCGDTFRTPGYPFFIALFYMLFGSKPWVVLFVQIFVDLITIYYVFRIGEMVFSRRVGVIASTFLAINPNSIFSTASLYSDGLFVMFLSAFLYFYLRGLKLGEERSFLIAGGLLALAVLIRPVAQYYFVTLLFVSLLWPTRNLVTRLKWGFLYTLAFIVIISPWLYRNYTLYDTIKLSSVQGETLLFWQVGYTRGWETNQPREIAAAEFKSQAKALGYSESNNPFTNESIAQNLAVQYIKEHPVVFASRWIKGMINTYTNLGTADIAHKLGLMSTSLSPDVFVNEKGFKLISLFFQTKSFAEIMLGLTVLGLLLTNYLTFLLGVDFLMRRHQLAILILFVGSIVFFTVPGGPMGLARYKLPCEPFYFLIGAVYIDHFLHRRALRVAAREHRDRIEGQSVT